MSAYEVDSYIAAAIRYTAILNTYNPGKNLALNSDVRLDAAGHRDACRKFFAAAFHADRNPALAPSAELLRKVARAHRDAAAY